VFAGLVALAACGPAEGVEVEPLPPMERPSAEQRAGLPHVAGTWRFAGWEVVNGEAAAALGEPGSPGDIHLTSQRIDSIAGFLVRGEQRIPLVGELRRDGIAALVARDGEAAYGYLAGRLDGDTLIVGIASLGGNEIASYGRGLIFVRGQVGQRIVRGADGRLLRDTAVAVPDTLPPAGPPTPARPPAMEPDAGDPAPAQPARPRPMEPADTPQPAPQPQPDPPQPEPTPEPVPPAPVERSPEPPGQDPGEPPL